MQKLTELTQFWHNRNARFRRSIKIIFALGLLGVTVRSLPYLAPIRASDIAQTEQAITFTDRNALRLGTILTQNQDRTAVVPLDRVSPHFIQAIIAAEDKRYDQNGALDGQAIARAILEALQAGEIVSGASTITMQLARMLEPAPRTLPNKVREVWMAWRLVAGMNKAEILHAYINRLPMGGNVYGVEAASRTYFGLPASELTLAHASLLAAIPNDPNQYNPNYNWRSLKNRQRYVLQRMVEDGYITATQADRAHAEEIQLLLPDRGILAAPHFLFWLANQLPDDISHLQTTLDRPLQEFVQAQVQHVVSALAPYNVHHAAALVIHNPTGEVLAYVGSPNYFADAQLGRNDGVQALRQPGSTLKPFLYQLALEKNAVAPHTILADVPTYYAIPGAKLYSPVDFSEKFLGPVRVRVALANSLNVPAVRVLERVGVATFLLRLQELGFHSLTESPEHYGLGLALGSGEVSLWELARAYVTIARQGERIALSVTDGGKEGEIPSPDSPHSLASPADWALITDMLSDRHARAQAFGVDSVLSLPFPAAVKTGTSSDFRDTWTVGFTRDYTVATWVGNFSGDRMKKVSGVRGAAPLWNRIMLHLHQDREPAAFPPPENMVQRPICATTGLKPTEECSSVVLEYFAPEDLTAYNQEAEFTLSDDYNEWLSRHNPPNFASDALKIVVPQNDDYFIRDRTQDNPRLQLKLAAIPETPVEWWIVGRQGKQRLAITESSDSIFWPLTVGEWTLEVKSGNRSDRVTFQVQPTESLPARRGFSAIEESTNTESP
ncbi:penicillin-binding protein 1C [Phormidium sp. CCY1219]|uniref:penicillin-binding protein 1C n=1 Tax=Phormidium sp. CCY1219 TaxID=2886104 RepID=UPI002D1F4870|nr:penicillin-binding protein 1C [Phormidium sp. CCY1219]MEB3829252.1 penicillin-binding protein 1C [Phormidium sp. CCY1219]